MVNPNDTLTPWTPTPGEPYRLQDLQPMRDRLLVAPLAVASRTRGGIHLAETAHQRERPQHGVVLKTGPGVWDPATQSYLPLQVRAGDCVFYGKYSGQEFTVADRGVLNMAEIEVFSVLPAGTFVVVTHDDPKLNHLQGDYCDICATPDERAAAAAPEPGASPAVSDQPNPLEAERERLRQERLAKEQAPA